MSAESRRVGKDNLEELDARCREKAKRVVGDILDRLGAERVDPSNVWSVLDLLRSRVFDQYRSYSYFNFGHPIYASLLVSPGGVFVKVLPVRGEESFERVYGVSVDAMRELVKRGLVVPVLDERIDLFRESDDVPLELVEESVRRDLILNYYYEELFRRALPPGGTRGATSLHDEVGRLSEGILDDVCRLSELIEWSNRLGVSKKLACDELAYNNFVTLAQYSLVSPEKYNLVKKILERSAIDAIEFAFYNSTFETDPLFYSPSGSVIADMADVRYGILELARMKLKIPDEVVRRIGTYVYNGLLLEVGASLVSSKRGRGLTVIKDVRRLDELREDIKKVAQRLERERMELVELIHRSILERRVELKELDSAVERYVDAVREIYSSISDRKGPGGTYWYLSVSALGIASMVLYLIAVGAYDIESIARAVPALVGSIAKAFNIIEVPLIVAKFASYLRRLSRLGAGVRSRMLEHQLSRLRIKLPTVVVMGASEQTPQAG